MTDRNLEHEKAVLSAIKVNNDLFDGLDVVESDFSDTENRRTYRAMGTILTAGGQIDDLSLYEALGHYAVLDLEAAASNAEFYAASLREYGKLRALRRIAGGIVDRMEAGDESSEIVSSVEDGLLGLGTTGKRAMVHIRDMIGPAIAEIERRYHMHGALPGLSCGFTGIDRHLQGLRGGNMIVIAARTSVGKTALALSMAARMAVKGINVGYFSCEMSRDEIGLRLLSMKAKLNMRMVASGMLKDSSFSELNDAATVLAGTSAWFDDTPNIALGDLRSRARRMYRLGVRCIFVDYLTLIKHGDKRMSRPERVGDVSKELKALARELDVPIIVLSQLNREAEGATPNLAQLRQSGEIEEDADVVMLLHRERESQDADLYLAKVRNGATGMVRMTFLADFVRFEEAA